MLSNQPNTTGTVTKYVLDDQLNPPSSEVVPRCGTEAKRGALAKVQVNNSHPKLERNQSIN